MSSQEDNNSKQKEFKIFNDSVHGHIKMHPLLVDIIDTPAFQRLRNIKQMGGVYFVFPGASHNRFEHSIGVAHLAGQLVQSLMDKQPELKIDKKDKLCVQIAGLCHDLGHGPFSHAFEDFMKELSERKKASEPTVAKVLSEWKHEEQSIEMFQFLIEKEKKDEKSIKTKMMNGHYGDELKFENKDFIFIEELINGPKSSSETGSTSNQANQEEPSKMGSNQANQEEPSKWNYRGRGPEKSFLYEIVSNKITGIDVDKMDYFSRDCHHLGMKSNFSHERYVMFARVCKTKESTKQICMRDKEALNMYELFHVCYLLHNNVYTHRVTKAVETMIFDALLKAEPHFKLDDKTISEVITEAATTQESFLRLTDDILQEIMRSTIKDLKAAQELIERVENRQLYKFVGSRKYKPEELKEISHEKWKSVVQKWLQSINKKDLKPEDFTVKTVSLNYGMKDKDPIDALSFYSKEKPNEVMKKEEMEEVSFLLPKNYAEVKVMLFYTKPVGAIRNILTAEEIKQFWNAVKA